MKKRFLLVLTLAFAILFYGLNAKASVPQLQITRSGGWFETAYLEWTCEGSRAFNVYVKPEAAPAVEYKQIDSELIREYENHWRADAVGLPEGNYVIKVEALLEDGSLTAVSETVNVKAYDRSGFAFSTVSKFKTASGAYNDDGSLKSGAKVLYIHSENAAKVELEVVKDEKGRTEVGVGLYNIFKLKEKGYDQTPLAIRIIGKVTAQDLGLEIKSKGYIDVKGREAYFPLNLTIEGIGEDAYAYGWGILLKRAGNVEIRNLGFAMFPDDAVSLDGENCNVWIHNNDFFYGTPGSDADQVKGDGSVDIKRASTHVSVSYNHFWDSGKASLCGLGETREFFVTYHHNWFDHSDSRHPRIRTGSIHIYNNYFDGVSKYGVGVTTGGNAFVEGNYFRNVKYPLLISKQGTDAYSGGSFSGEPGGMIKAYNNIIMGAKRLVYANADAVTEPKDEVEFDAYLAYTRTETVPGSFKAKFGNTSYNNFDTLIDIGVTEAKIDAPAEVPGIVQERAGRMNGGDFSWTFTEADDVSYDVNQALKNALSTYVSQIVSVGGNSTIPGPGEPEDPEEPGNPGEQEPLDPERPWIIFWDDFSNATTGLFFTAGFKSLPGDASKPMYIKTGGSISIEEGRVIMDGGRFTIGAFSSSNTSSGSTPGGAFDLSKPYRIKIALVSASGNVGKKFQVYVDNNTTSAGNSIHGSASKVFEIEIKNLTPGEIVIEPGIGTENSFIQIRVESQGIVEIEEILIEYLDHQEPEEPEVPEDPDEPGYPEEPEDPEDPDEPGDPEEPEDPEDPEEPGDPEEPEEPVEDKKDDKTKTIIFIALGIVLVFGIVPAVTFTLKFAFKSTL